MASNNTGFTKGEKEIARSLGIATESLYEFTKMVNELSSIQSHLKSLETRKAQLELESKKSGISDTEKALYKMKIAEIDIERDEKKRLQGKKAKTFKRVTGKEWQLTGTNDELKESANKVEEEQMAKVFGKNGAKINKIAKGVDVAAKILDGIQKFVQLSYDLQLNELNYIQKVNKAGLSVAGSRLSKTTAGSLTGITSGATEGSFAAAGNAIELQKEIADYGRTKKMAELQMANFAKIRISESIVGGLTAASTAIGAAIGTAIAPGIGTVLGAAIGGLVGGIGNIVTTFIKGEAQISEKKLELLNEQFEHMDSIFADISKQILGTTKDINNFFLTSEKAANNMGLAFGYTGQQLELYKASAYKTQIVISKWGKTLEDFARMQSQYAETTGRNILMTSSDADSSFALGKLIGEDSQLGIASQMELFGKSISDSNEIVFEMYKNVNNMGLSGRKFAKDLNQNLKLASRYNFKGGVEGLMKMSMWAQKTRFNMSSLSSMLDEIQNGSIEDVITKSAGFQVLGGQAAIHSDPLGMLFDAWADPDAYAKRMQDMTKGFGVFNEKTGETTFNMPESMQLAQIAKLQGRSVDELRNEIIERNKRNKVEGMLNPHQNFNSLEKTAIGSKAHVKNGKWVVTLLNSNGETEEKDVRDLNKNDLKNLMPETNEEELIKYASESRDFLAQIAGATIKGKSETISNLSDTFSRHQKSVIGEEQDFWEKIKNNFGGLITEELKFIVDQQKQQHDLFIKNTEEIKKINQLTIQRAQSIADDLGKADSIIRKYLEVMTEKDPVKKQQGMQELLDLTTTRKYEKEENAKKLDAAADAAYKKRDYATSFSYSADAEQLRGHSISSIGYNRMSFRQMSGGLMRDGFAVGNGNPMMLKASDITPIEDGSVKLSKSDPRDTALFAKTGGPFDKLFDDVFGKVNDIYGFIGQYSPNPRANSGFSVMPETEREYMMPSSPAMSDFYGTSNNSGYGNSQGTGFSQPLDINIHGDINLKSPNGESIDIFNELRNNPMFVRQITELVVLQMNNNTHGGRNELFHNRFT